LKLLICRTIIIYLCVLFAMRLMGKRQLGELQPEELVSTILISNLASISIESEEVPITSSLIPLFLIAALELLGSVLSFRSQKFFNFLSGRPKTVILDCRTSADCPPAPARAAPGERCRMKRIYACLCIVAVLLGVAFYSRLPM